ncbi:MAG: hypothetical protein N3A66_00445 [Planctomycetota bacterium]|nr:hypothetical protein [Planctomycetota bacterium]
MLADVQAPPPLVQPSPPAAAPVPAAASTLPLTSIRESLSLLESAGEVEGVAGQIASLLGQLAERARRFQTSWLASDQEAKELRTRLAAEEHRRLVLESERRALQEEVETLRKRLSAAEAEKLAQQEAARTEIAGLQMRQREQETRIGLLESQIRSLEEEMNRARSEATSADLESRRARFEADRLRAEIESERMERMRLQRALDNREKELQAIQAQTAGQASSLFLDELHRLVRRLERELDLRTSAAHEALIALDRLQTTEEMTPIISVLRAALLTAAGQEVDESDTLRKLGVEVDKAATPSSATAVSPVERNLGAFEVSLAALDLTHAREIAAELLKEGRATPAHLMSKIYLSPGLRREEVRSRLDDVVSLMQDVRQAQDAADKTRGRQGADTEQLYAQMFDYFHNLVRLKILTRANTGAWEFFLDLRSRYSFITSDKQWQEYRDRVLKR